MPGFFREMGVIQWPMYVAALFLLLQIGRATFQVRQPVEARSPMTLHTILVWGLLNALLGILGTVVGFAVAGQSIERIGQVSPPLVAGGIRVALTSTIFGLLLLTLAVMAWLVLYFVGGRSRAGA